MSSSAFTTDEEEEMVLRQVNAMCCPAISNIDYLQGNTTYIAQTEGEGDIWQVVLPWIR